jgi:membrane protease YdiL (CAAX protease family)
VQQQIRSVPWSAKNALVVFLVPWIALPLILIIFLNVLAPSVGWAHQFVVAFEKSDPKASFALVIVDALGSWWLIRHYLKRYGANLRQLGLRRFSWWRAVLTIAAIYIIFFVAVALLLALVSVLVPSFNANQPQTNDFTGLGPQFRDLSFLALVIIPPLVEEPVFRGFMFPAFAKRFGIWGGAIISSLLFGLAHLQANVSIYTLVLGLLLCFLYVRLGSIIPGIALHMLNNLIAYSALYHK